MNYCTVSYSAAWWDWERWQRELDFMAMNSINMPLSVVGLEAVWYNTLLKHKFTDEEARQFLAGPGHFAWQWMQNLQSYGGPLPKSWIDKHIVWETDYRPGVGIGDATHSTRILRLCSA